MIQRSGSSASQTLANVLVLMLAMIALAQAPAQAVVDVWIDPGHGAVGKKGRYDGGAEGIDGPAAPNEEDLAWGTSLYLQGYLEAYGFSTALTRNDNGFRADTLTPRQRTQVLNGERLNDIGFQDSSRILVSVHMNSTTDSTTVGTTTYWNLKAGPRLSYNFAASYSLAGTVHPALMTYVNTAFPFQTPPCRKDLHVLLGNFFMIRDVKVPAILEEVCFISNRCQENIIRQDAKQALMAQGIATGVSNYMAPGGLLRAEPIPLPATPGWTRELRERPATRTGAVATAIAFAEGFDGLTFPPNDWTLQTTGGPIPHRWARTTDTLITNTGLGSAILIGQYGSANDEWLISPMIKVGGLNRVLSFFWAGNRDRSSSANATCSIRRKGAGSWTQLWSMATEPQATPFVFRERAVDLAAYLNDSVQVAFRVQGTNGPDFAIDDVALGNFVPTAQAVNDHCAGAIPFPSGAFSVSGVNCYASNDWDPTTTPDTLLCVQDDMDGPDVVYSLNAVAGDVLFINVAGGWNPGVYLLDDCSASFPLCFAGAYPIDGMSRRDSAATARREVGFVPSTAVRTVARYKQEGEADLLDHRTDNGTRNHPQRTIGALLEMILPTSPAAATSSDGWCSPPDAKSWKVI